MPSAISVLDEQNLTIGRALLGRHGAGRGSVKQQVHDGDTLVVEPDGNISVRFLGIDTPEVSFQFPGQTRFVSLADARWSEFLESPFDERWGEFKAPLPMGLRAWLASRCGPHAAANHHQHSRLAEEALENEILRDIAVMQTTSDEFRFFLAFAYEVMDGYGRFLCYINREQPDRNLPAPRPPTYNERMLEQGRACPYFIWPNVNPWKKADSIIAAVPEPGTAATAAAEDETLRRGREWVQQAREKHLGIFDAMNPLALEPFELRMLARRSVPGRWVVDLSRNDDLLVHPANYPSIPRSEDRLWISAEYVPLFVERGWRRQSL